jgi:hypothetical protein
LRNAHISSATKPEEFPKIDAKDCLDIVSSSQSGAAPALVDPPGTVLADSHAVGSTKMLDPAGRLPESPSGDRATSGLDANSEAIFSCIALHVPSGVGP